MNYPKEIWADTDLVCSDKPVEGWEKYVRVEENSKNPNSFIRPEHWSQLPSDLIEYLCDQIQLDYDSYESSKVETVNNILNDPSGVSHTNDDELQRAYCYLSNEDIIRVIQQSIATHERIINRLKDFSKIS